MCGTVDYIFNQLKKNEEAIKNVRELTLRTLRPARILLLCSAGLTVATLLSVLKGDRLRNKQLEITNKRINELSDIVVVLLKNQQKEEPENVDETKG